MRVDKFLKVSRIIKRRTIANWRQKHHLPVNPQKEESRNA